LLKLGSIESAEPFLPITHSCIQLLGYCVELYSVQRTITNLSSYKTVVSLAARQMSYTPIIIIRLKYKVRSFKEDKGMYREYY